MFDKPRLYQQDIINKTLETTKSTLIQLPTGGGKTIISKEIATELIIKFNKKILFIAPKIVLMKQTLKEFQWLKPQKVHGSNNKFDKNHHILISTLQTAPNRDLNPDVIIIDEIHYGYDGEMLKKLIENNSKARIIGLSATPYDQNGYLLKGFDVILNDYDLTYLIKNKYLVPLRSFVLVKPDLSNIDIIAGDYEINQLSEAVSKNTIIMEIVTTSKPYIEESIKTIVFAVDINHAELLKTAFQNEGFMTESLHSKREEDDNEVIDRFKKGYVKVLVSVLKLTTGFDVPETDLAIIARPTKSQNLYKQMVGRVLRIAPNKKNAILLDCGNVIENLGKPLDPIIPKDELEKKTQKLKCKHCDSENIKLKKSDSNMYWECQDCGHKKDLENKNHYTCSNCNKKYSYENGEFELINKTLYLNCECGYETEISVATGDEEFKEVDSGIGIKLITENLDDYTVSLAKHESLTVENIYIFFDEIRNYKNQEINKFSEEIRNKVLISNPIYFSIEEEKRTLLNILCERTILSLKELNSVELIDSIFKQSNIYLNNIAFMEYFSDYYIIHKNFFKEFKIEILKDIEKNKKFDLLIILIESNFVDINYVMEQTYTHKFYNIVEFLIKKYQINKFNYYLSVDIDLESDTLLEKTDLAFFDSISDFINFIDLGKSFSLIDILEFENNEIAFGKLINDLILLKNHFKQKDVRILVYDKEISFDFFDFSLVKDFIHQKNFKKLEDWFKYIDSAEKATLIPFTPNKVYSEWTNWEDFLGNENLIDEDTFDYLEEKIFLFNLVFDNKLTKRNIEELEILKKYFEYTDNKYLSFEESKKYVHSLNVESRKDWDKLVLENNLPKFIHKYPQFHFSKLGWENWNDWLGIQNKSVTKLKSNNFSDNSNYLSYDNAKKYIKEKGIKTKNEWKSFVNREGFPDFLPVEPHSFYQNSGWISFDHWLDKKIIIKNKIEEISMREIDSDLNKSIIGSYVSHKKFGKGKIIDSERNAKEHFLTIDFNGSIKKILSSFLD